MYRTPFPLPLLRISLGHGHRQPYYAVRQAASLGSIGLL